jgi:hypothetical protein
VSIPYRQSTLCENTQIKPLTVYLASHSYVQGHRVDTKAHRHIVKQLHHPRLNPILTTPPNETPQLPPKPAQLPAKQPPGLDNHAAERATSQHPTSHPDTWGWGETPGSALNQTSSHDGLDACLLDLPPTLCITSWLTTSRVHLLAIEMNKASEDYISTDLQVSMHEWMGARICIKQGRTRTVGWGGYEEQSAVEYGREISTGERRRRRLAEVQR